MISFNLTSHNSPQLCIQSPLLSWSTSKGANIQRVVYFSCNPKVTIFWYIIAPRGTRESGLVAKVKNMALAWRQYKVSVPLKKKVVLRRTNVIKNVTVFKSVYSLTIFTRHFPSNSAPKSINRRAGSETGEKRSD